MRQWCLMDSESRKRPDEVDDVFLVVYEERSVARSDSFRHQDKKRGRFLIPFTTKTSRNDWVAPRESPAAREQRRKKKKKKFDWKEEQLYSCWDPKGQREQERRSFWSDISRRIILVTLINISPAGANKAPPTSNIPEETQLRTWRLSVSRVKDCWRSGSFGSHHASLRSLPFHSYFPSLFWLPFPFLLFSY